MLEINKSKRNSMEKNVCVCGKTLCIFKWISKINEKLILITL